MDAKDAERMISLIELNVAALKEQMRRDCGARTVVDSGIAELRLTLNYVERQYSRKVKG